MYMFVRVFSVNTVLCICIYGLSMCLCCIRPNKSYVVNVVVDDLSNTLLLKKAILWVPWWWSWWQH